MRCRVEELINAWHLESFCLYHQFAQRNAQCLQELDIFLRAGFLCKRTMKNYFIRAQKNQALQVRRLPIQLLTEL